MSKATSAPRTPELASKHSKQPALSDTEDDEHLVNGDSIDTPYDECRLYMQGFSDTCTDEMIRLYLLLIVNNSLDEKLKIEELRRNASRVIVKFNKALNFDDIKARQLKVPELCGEKIKLHKVKIPNSVKLLDLSSNCNEEILTLYFTNAKVSDGGDIERIRLFNLENRALIQFKNYGIVDRLLSRSHIICENTVKLEKFYSQIEDFNFYDPNEDQKTKSSKPRKSLAPDQLALYSSSTTTTSATVDKTKLVLSNIQENINIQQLEFFINLLTNKSDISQISWSYEFKGKLLIEFKKEIDIKNVQHEFNKNNFNNLNGKPIQLETVNLTRTLILIIKELTAQKPQAKRQDPVIGGNYNPNNYDDASEVAKIPATRDLLELYFINKQRSGGGDIEYIERKSSHYWLVRMKDQRTIRELITRRHLVDFKQIKVFPYYDNFGLPYLIHLTLEDETDFGYKLKIKDERLRYFVKNKGLHMRLNDILSESNAISKHHKNEPNVLYVQYYHKLSTKVAYLEKIWRIRVKESIEYFLHIYKYEKLTLSYNQWTTILKTKQINENALYKSSEIDDDDGARIIDNELTDANKMKLFGNLAFISIKDTNSNIEVNVAGPVLEVDKFSAKIKDIICKAYFTYELEERIINFKTYLLDCEQLLNKWLHTNEFSANGLASDDDSDVEILLSSAARSSANNADTLSITAASYSSYKRRTGGDDSAATGHLDKNKRKTIDDFICKLERDHIDMELAYRKLFQELGYTFLSHAQAFVPGDAAEQQQQQQQDEYRELNDHHTYNGMNETFLGSTDDVESEMDRLKRTLDELKTRIGEMRKRFRDYLILLKKNRKPKQQQQQHLQAVVPKQRGGNAGRQSRASDMDDSVDDVNDDDTDENEDDGGDPNMIQICVYVKEQMKLITLKINRRYKVKELKAILLKELNTSDIKSTDRLKLVCGGIEMSNDLYTVTDYGVTAKSTISCEFTK